MISIRKIEKLASDLALKQGGKKLPYVDVERVAEYLSIEINRDDLGADVSGVLIIKNGKGVIGINDIETHNTVRMRFTIAHEIGHYVLHRFDQNVFVDNKNFKVPFQKGLKVFHRDSDSASGRFEMEREANAFAAALLMPRDLIMRELTKKTFDMMDDEDDFIVKLAKKFEVSQQAMTFRLTNLEIF